MAEAPKDISGADLEELKALLLRALEENARLKAENVKLREVPLLRFEVIGAERRAVRPVWARG